MSTIRDGLKIVGEWVLESSTALFAINSTRVSLINAPQGFDNTATQLIIRPASLVGEQVVRVAEDDYTFHCYGGTDGPEAATTLAIAAYARMTGSDPGTGAARDTATGGLLLVTPLGMNALTEPDTGFPVTLQRFRVKTS